MNSIDIGLSEITYRRAFSQTIEEEMERDDTIFLVGEDVGAQGGTFGLTKGLFSKFGEWRVRDTPISEEGFVGLAVGAAAVGLRPIVEIMFMDFITLAMDEICNQAAKLMYLYEIKAPIVIYTLYGIGFRAGVHHSQSLESWFMNVPGLKVVMPSTPADLRGLLKSSIRDDNPVIFLLHKSLLRLKEKVRTAEYLIPLGSADIKREGSDVTVITAGLMVHRSLEAADRLSKEDGINIEVIDLRTLSPLDVETIVTSVRKTSRAVIVQEGVKQMGFGAEVAAVISEEAMDWLDAPIKRIATPFIPIPFGHLEEHVVPDVQRIIDSVRDIL